MKPKKSPQKDRQQELFLIKLVRIIDPGHALVKLAKVVDRDRPDELFGATYCPDKGRPGIAARLMVALHYLKYIYNLSDDDVVEGWVENPYWQYFSGMYLKQKNAWLTSVQNIGRWFKKNNRDFLTREL